MNYYSSIIVETDNPKALLSVFDAEKSNNTNGRAQWNIVSENNKIIFNFEARDSVALRAVMNSITKLLTVYEKLDTLKV